MRDSEHPMSPIDDSRCALCEGRGHTEGVPPHFIPVPCSACSETRRRNFIVQMDAASRTERPASEGFKRLGPDLYVSDFKYDERAAFKQGAEAAAAVADEYNSLSLHDHRLGDCILAKLNLREEPVQPNEHRRGRVVTREALRQALEAAGYEIADRQATTIDRLSSVLAFRLRDAYLPLVMEMPLGMAVNDARFVLGTHTLQIDLPNGWKSELCYREGAIFLRFHQPEPKEWTILLNLRATDLLLGVHFVEQMPKDIDPADAILHQSSDVLSSPMVKLCACCGAIARHGTFGLPWCGFASCVSKLRAKAGKG